MRYEQRAVHAGDVDAHAVDAADAHLAAAKALAAYGDRCPGGILHLDIHCVGVKCRVVARLYKPCLEAGFACQLE